MPGWLCEAARLSYAVVVLPILRTTLLGGALAAAAFLTGFTIPEYTRPHLAQAPAPARGALQHAQDHPEWKHLLMLAAVRRALELDRLRELPSQPQPAPALAALPPTREDAEPADATATVTDAPETVLTIDIGETSSTELPIGTHQIVPQRERPQSLRPAKRSELKPVRQRRKARVKPVQPAKAATNPFSTLFGLN